MKPSVPKVYHGVGEVPVHHTTCKVKSTSILSLALLLILLFSPQIKAQEQIVFADSTTLSCPPWQGTLAKFSLTPQGVALHDLSPQRTNNKAALLHTPTLSGIHTWRGEISFRFAITSANTFVVLIAPLSAPTQENGYTTCRYAYLSGEKTGSIGLFEGNFSLGKDGIIRHKDKNADKPIVTSSANDAIRFTSPNLHHLAWHITYSGTEGWQLYLKKSLQPQQKFIYIGCDSTSLPPQDYAQGSFSGIALRYSLKNAQHFTLHRLLYSQKPLAANETPSPPTESIFAAVDFTPQSIRLITHSLVSIESADFNLQPSCGTLTPGIKGKTITLDLETPFKSGNYSLFVRGIKTLDGALAPSERIDFEISLPSDSIGLGKPDEEHLPQDHLLLSEVLPHPTAHAAEFVEVYNPTTHSIDIRDYALAVRSEGRRSKLYPLIVEKNHLIQPNEYRAITPWKRGLADYYHCSIDSLSEVEKLPALPNREGQIVLYSLRDSVVVEEMFYGPKIASRGEMSEGVSLERILFSRPALAPDNWHVARPEQGNATPGRPNSVRVECDLPIEEREGETLTPEQIAALTLYALQDPANNATLTLYTLRGYRSAVVGRSATQAWCRALLRGELTQLYTRPPHTPYIVSIELTTARHSKRYSFVVAP